MHELSPQGIKDFQICALLHDFRHRQELPEAISSQEILAQRYENVLKRVIFFYFYRRQGGVVPSFNVLVNRWEKLWFPKEMTAYDIALMQNNQYQGNIVSYSNSAAESLTAFYEDFTTTYKNLGEPILIDEEYVVPLSKNLKLKGKIDLVMRLGKNITVIKLVTRSKRSPLGNHMMDLAAMRYAFAYRNNSKDVNIDYKLYDVGTNSPGFVDLVAKAEDVRALLYWAQEAYSTETFVPRRGLTAYCKGCPFDSDCKKFVISDEMLRRQIDENE